MLITNTEKISYLCSACCIAGYESELNTLAQSSLVGIDPPMPSPATSILEEATSQTANEATSLDLLNLDFFNFIDMPQNIFDDLFD